MRPQVHTFAAMIAVALAFAAAPAPAGAAPADQISTRVQVADLNLQSPAGARVALQRLRNAARAICGEEAGVRDLGRQALSQACVRRAVSATVASAGSPALAALNATPVAETTLAAAD